MAKRLFGLEAELALSATRCAQALSTNALVQEFLAVARETIVHLPGAEGWSSRLFLGNGGLLYIDAGLHPEVATPECTTPAHAVCHLRALERLVQRLASIAGGRLGAESVLVSRVNLDYLLGTSWGCHESYGGQRPVGAYSDWLIPHLASRIVYTGAGGLDPSSPGIRFSLSPRASHIEYASSPESTARRGIFHTRDEPLCRGYSRIHVLAGDNACSHRATWLKVGTTALVVVLAEVAPSNEVIKLLDPVRAMKGFARDTRHRARVRIGAQPIGSLTAAEVQRELLARVRIHADAPCMPDWAPEVCTAWEAALDLIDSPAVRESHALDWPLKFALFRREIARRRFTDGQIAAWTSALELLRRAVPPDDAPEKLTQIDPARINGLQAKGALPQADLAAAARILAAQGLALEGLDEFNALRQQLCAIDVRFGVLETGLFDTLDRARLIPEHRLLSDDEIERAVSEPPPGSRAAVRGRWIKKLARRRARFHCDWSGIFGEHDVLDLSDPFAPKAVRRPRRGAIAKPPPRQTGPSVPLLDTTPPGATADVPI